MPNPIVIESTNQARKQMVEYLKLKVSLEDWHGVADAAMDLREIDAKLEVLTNELLAR